MTGNEKADPRILYGAAALALALWLTLLLSRTLILWPDLSGLGALPAAMTVLGASVQDTFLAMMFGGIAFLLLRGAALSRRRWPWLGLLGLITLLLLFWSVGNIASVRLLTGPVTPRWLQFSGVLDSNYMIVSLAAQASVWRLAGVLALIGAFVMVVWSLRAAIVAIAPRRDQIITAAFVPLVLASAAAQLQAPTTDGKRQNAVLAFAAAAVFPDQMTTGAIAQLGDGQITAQLAAPSDKWTFAGVSPVQQPRPPQPARPLENLVLVVLESTGFRAVAGYPGAVDAAPNLSRYSAEMGLLVTDTYAHAPSSAFSLASIIAGLEPDLWAESMTVDREDLLIEGLASLMKNRVSRAGYFDSSDKWFQNAGAFALRSGFDFVRDLNDWECTLGLSLSDAHSGESLDKAHDHCTFAAAAEWVTSAPEEPFFLTVWTGMAHYPYMTSGPEQAFVADPSHNTYLNAVHTTDQGLGMLVEHLRDNDLLETTLIVVVGDHGEAFGEHGQYGHATGLWEENLRVPLVFLNPQLFPTGQRAEMLASLTDIAPTIADLFGLPAPESWHGQSLFAKDRPDGLFIFAPWAGLQIGFRQADRKVILNANSGQMLMYDLATDPAEAVDLTAANPALADAARAELAQWVVWQTANRSVKGAAQLASEPPAPMAETHADPGGAGVPVVIRATGTFFQNPPEALLFLDGAQVGAFTVAHALSNADAAVADSDLASSYADIAMTLPATSCPRLLEIEFQNDNWEGEGQTGDTDLYIKSVEVAGKSYGSFSFRPVTDRVGGDYYDVFRMSRNGRMAVDLAISDTCLVDHIATP